MTSVTLPRRAHNLHLIRDHRNNHSCQTDDEETNSIINKSHHYSYNRSKIDKPTRTLSYDEPKPGSPSVASSNRLKHLCSRFKRRFSFSKEHRTHSEDADGSASERRMIRFNNYKSFSSSIEDPFNDFEWPDFEKIYDSIPPCLINALPGLDDFSIEENDDYTFNICLFETDETVNCSIEQMDLFLKCKRGKDFRRNAICSKIDKSQYHAQLDTFTQQLMIEKLMRTWT